MRAAALVLSLLIFVAADAPAAAHAAKVVAKIELSEQWMRVYKDGTLAYSWPVSTARKGYRTPTGTYRPTRMHRMWHSRKYDMAPMPHSIFFHGGYAIHGTDAIKSLGRAASHGCVRLHPANARTLFNLVRQVGPTRTSIVIQR